MTLFLKKFILLSWVLMAGNFAYGFDQEFFQSNDHCGEDLSELIGLPLNDDGSLNRSSMMTNDMFDHFYFTALRDTVKIIVPKRDMQMILMDDSCDKDHPERRTGQEYDVDENGQLKNGGTYRMTFYKLTPGKKYFIRLMNTKRHSNLRYNLKVEYLEAVEKNKDYPFEIVNPKNTRNIPGDFLILGNTSMCRYKEENTMPDGPNGCWDYETEAHEGSSPGNNNHYINYIDIDNDSSTWNSSAATFNLKKGSEVVWAGLFWQGNLFTTHETEGIQIEAELAKSTGSGFIYEEIGVNDKIFNKNHYDEEKIKLKIDNNSDYENITANNVYYSGYYNSSTLPLGGPYAAYADVTNIVKSSVTQEGEHKITVANITGHRGHERQLGIYGGWSLVVIYKNPEMHPKNISIFSGFTQVRDHRDHWKKEINVSGFRLPKSSKIEAGLSIFTGEGESSITGDTIQIDNKFIPAPKIKDQYNVFDGIPDFDGTRFPSHKYTTNIDISRFDISDIMTQKGRDTKEIDITLYCDYKGVGNGGVVPNNKKDTDAYFPSMLAFSVDLYIPDVCYDYDIRMGEDVPINSENRDINSSIIPGHNIHTVIALRSREGDLDLDNATLALKFNKQASKIKFIQAKQSSDDVNFYEDAKIINSTNPVMIAIGKDAHIAPGTIKPKQTTYADFEYQIKTPNLDTNFDIMFNAMIDYGSGDYNVTKNTLNGTLMRCGTERGYNPESGIFNVERVDSDDFPISQPNKRFPLHTQVAGKLFKLQVVHYDKNGKREVSLDDEFDVMLELIDANRFHIDKKTGKSIFVCSYPQGIPGTKQTRGIGAGKSRAGIRFTTDTSLPNVAVRIKYVVSPSGKLIPIFDCDHGNNKQCNKSAYDGNFEGDTYCNIICDKNSNTTDRECRDCVEKYWVKSVCSRDNFAIRPESYNISIYDTNQSKENDAKQLVINDKKDDKNFVAQYKYLIDANATLYRSKKSVSSYYQDFNLEGESELNYNDTKFDTALTLYNKNAAGCNNKKSKRYKLSFYNGKVLGEENEISSKAMGAVLESADIGKYLLHLADKDFTIVDQKRYPNKRYDTDDCLVDNTTVTENYESGINGCVTATDINGIGHSGSKHYDIDMHFVPDHFDLSSIELTRGSSSGKKWIYMSSLPSTMALKASGLITAVGAKGDNLSNFTSSCLAEDVNMSIKLKSNPGLDNIYSSNGIKVDFKYIIDTENVSVTKNGSFLNSSDNFSTDENETTHAFALNKNMFTDDLNGSAKLNVNYNFERTYDDPVNPVKLSIKEMKTSIDGIDVNGHMQADYIPEGIREYNEDFTFFYAAGIPSRSLYSTKESNITTPVSVRIYCDRLYEECKEKGIGGANAQLTLPWWRPNGHDSYSGDGQIILKVDSHSKISINKGALDISTTTGEDQGIIVTNVDATQDVEYPVNLVTGPATPATSDWLIYNALSNSIPTPFYTNKFLGGSGWAGIGESGKTLDAKVPIRKSNRLQW